MNIKLLVIIATITAINISNSVSHCSAQSGSLDNTFGIGGKVTTAIGSSTDAGNSVAIQGDGKIIVAGSSNNGANSDVALIRYNNDGSLDNNFGIGGKVTTAIGNSYDDGYCVALQSDGKILVAGTSDSSSSYDFSIVRYNSDGSLDNAFGIGGKVTTDFAGGCSDWGYSIAIQIDGKILVAGSHTTGGNRAYFALARYNSNGSLDNTFGVGGQVTTAIGDYYDFSYSVAIQSDGKIVVAGTNQFTFGNVDFALIRYNSNGSLDNNFGTSGKVTTDIGGINNYGFSVVLQSDGKIIVAGGSGNGTTTDFTIVRYNNDGTLDNTFGTGGKVITAIGSASDRAYSVILQSDGKIVVAGDTHNGLNYDFALVRYNSNGSLDNTFGINGKVTTAIGGTDDNGYSAAIQSDGKIVVAGSSFNGNKTDFAIVRYNNTILIGIDEEDFNHQNKLNIYPNPFYAWTTLQTDKPFENATLTVYSSIMQPVKLIDNLSGQSIIFNRSNLPSGLYFLHLTHDNKTIATDKLIITDN
jgi:uncharacterized delta-60 repeat protein